jgi:hypothetical protein
MKTPLEPSRFLVDPAIRPFIKDFRIDLAAADVPVLSADEFIVVDHVNQGQDVLVVKAIMPYVMRRTDIETPSESFAMVAPEQGNGHFVFTPRVGGGVPGLINIDTNNPTVSTAPANGTDRLRLAGIDNITDHPYLDAMRVWDNPVNSFIVKGRTQFQVTFRLAPTNMPGRFRIGEGDNRIDFAGCYVVGVLMPDQLYGELFAAAMRGDG